MECRLSFENKNGKHVANDDDGCLESQMTMNTIATSYNMI